MFVKGQVPDSAPEKVFEAEKNSEFDDDYDIDDYDDLDFEEHWN
jgi:hypothetical protein